MSNYSITIVAATLAVLCLASCSDHRVAAGSFQDITVVPLGDLDKRIPVGFNAFKIVVTSNGGRESTLICTCADAGLISMVTGPGLPCSLGVRNVTSQEATEHGLPPSLSGTFIMFWGKELTCSAQVDRGLIKKLDHSQLEQLLRLYRPDA
jgi:hypothetical protein